MWMLFAQIIFYGLVSIICLPMLIYGEDRAPRVKELVSSYFETVFEVPKVDIQWNFIHLPEIDVKFQDNYQLLIESRTNHPRVGPQTLLLIISDGQYLIEKQPVRVDVSIFLDVVVTNHKLGRGEIVTPENIRTKRVRVYRNYNNYFRDVDDVVGLMTTQVVKEGDIIQSSMVREAPDINKGDEVKIQLKRGDLLITTEGKVKEEGMIGDQVKVICESTKKQIIGTIETPQLVVVKLK